MALIQVHEFKYYRNLVNSERKSCRGKYYEANVHNLGKVGPKKWWSEVKRLSNFKTKEGLSNLTNVAEFSNSSLEEQASKINTIFLDSLNEYSLQFPLPKLPSKSHLFSQTCQKLWYIRLYQNLKLTVQRVRMKYLTGA